MFGDAEDHDGLYMIAQAIGLNRAWFRSGGRTPHYDLTRGRRAQAIAVSAVPVGRSLAVRIRRTGRAHAGKAAPMAK
jgi:hypothetical protein